MMSLSIYSQRQMKMFCLGGIHVGNDSSYIIRYDKREIIDVEIKKEKHYTYATIGPYHNFRGLNEHKLKLEATDSWLHYIHCVFSEDFSSLMWHRHEGVKGRSRVWWDEYLFYVQDSVMDIILSKDK